MQDLLVTTKAGMARMSGGGAVDALFGPSGTNAEAVFRRFGSVLLVVGIIAGGVWIANMTGWLRMPSFLRFVTAAIGIGAIGIGWQMRKTKFDTGNMLDEALGEADVIGGLKNNSKLQKAIADIGEIELTIGSSNVRMAASGKVVSCEWSEIASVRRDGEYIIIEGKGLAGLIVALPPRALPEGTNHDAMFALLTSLQRGEPVTGIE